MARSLQEIIRQRQRAGFVGRTAHLAFFRDNLHTQLNDERRRFLFTIHGDGGIGKSFLVSRLRQIADESGRICAVVDDSVYDIPEAIASIAEQFDQQGARLKRFAQRYDAYRKRRRELEAGTTSADHDDTASKVTKAVVRVGYGAVRGTPIGGAIAEAVDPAATAEAVDQIRSAAADKMRHRDDERQLSPVQELTRVFVDGVRQLAKPVALFFDTYERTSPFLDDWIRALFNGDFGDLPPDIIVTLSGRHPLDTSRWSAYLDFLQDVPLDPFTEAEARQLLIQKGVTEEQMVEVILRISDGLPLAVAMLAESGSSASSAVGDPAGSVVERFLQWEDDPARREMALAAALPRWIDQDVLATIAEPAGVSELFGWLTRQSFVTQSGGRCHYHDVVRGPMLRLNRSRSPQKWRELHGKLAAAFHDWRKSGPHQDDWSDPRGQELELAECYHRLCADHAQGLPIALGKAVSACAESAGLARRWAEMIVTAGVDGDVAAVADIGRTLEGSLSKESGRRTAYLDELLRHPRFPEAERYRAFRIRGVQYRHGERYDEALADFNTSLELSPDYADALAGRGETYRLMERYDEALADFDRAVELDPDAWNVGSRGQVYRQRERYEEALGDLERAVELDPEMAWALAERGETYRQLGRYEEAVRDFDQTVELRPQNIWAISGRGEAYRSMGHNEEALKDFDRAIEIIPEYVWGIVKRGQVYRQRERYEEALRDFDRAVELAPDDDWVIAERGETYRLMEWYEEAVRDFDRAIELDPQYIWAIAKRGDSYRCAERHEDAIRDLDRAIEASPDYSWAIGSRAQTYRCMERYEEAVRDFDRAVELDPQYVWAIANRGETYRLMRRFDEALRDFDRTIELDADLDLGFAGRGRIYRNMGDHAKSIAEFDRSVRLAPFDDYYIAERAITSGIEHRGADAFRYVVDVEVRPLEAASLLRSLTEWLISAGIIEPQLSACVPGSNRGYAPGPSCERAIAEPFPQGRRFNGVRVETGRWVCPSPTMRTATCPACQARVEARENGRPTAVWETLNDAILLWHDGGNGSWRCPECHEPSHLNDWEIDPPWALGNLVLLFWNWPPLRAEFISEIGRLLGHRLTVVSGTV